MTQEELNKEFDPDAKRCWMCMHCTYDMSKGNYCQEFKKQLGGHYDICKPNTCEGFTKDK